MRNIWRASKNDQNATFPELQILLCEENNAAERGSGLPSRLMTGPSRRMPRGVSMNLAQQRVRLQAQSA